jgi:hypothetical protein
MSQCHGKTDSIRLPDIWVCLFVGPIPLCQLSAWRKMAKVFPMPDRCRECRASRRSVTHSSPPTSSTRQGKRATRGKPGYIITAPRCHSTRVPSAWNHKYGNSAFVKAPELESLTFPCSYHAYSICGIPTPGMLFRPMLFERLGNTHPSGLSM